MTQALPATTRPMNRKERRQAARSAKRGQRRGAASATSPGRASDPVHPTLQRAALLHRDGDLEGAEPLYRDVLAEDSEQPDALLMLGVLLATRGSQAQAIELLSRAAAITPDNPNVHYNLAVAYSLTHQDEAAMRSYQAALELRPDYPEARKGLAVLHKRQGNLNAALEAMEQSLRENPDDGEAHHTIALFLQVLGRAEEALEHLKDFARLCPENAEAQALLGQAYLEQRQTDGAVIAFSECLKLDPDNNYVRSRLAMLLFDVGHYDGAYRLAVDAIHREPDLPITNVVFAKVVLRCVPEIYSREVEEALCLAYDRNYCKHEELGRAAITTVHLKYSEQAQQQKRDKEAAGLPVGSDTVVRLDGIMADELLLKVLDQSKAIDRQFEAFLTSIRRAVLHAAPKEASLSVPARRFIATLARHCYENAYVFSITEEENAVVQEIKESLPGQLDDLSDALPALENKLALIALYESLIDLTVAQTLGELPIERWSEECRPLIKAALLNPLEERRIWPTIQSITEIEDEVSKKVQAQYESNPYPRWWHCADGSPIDFVSFLAQDLPHFTPPDFLSGPLDVLVAGSGTGRHPISLARYTKNCNILAVDLSRTSLAYAIRMAREFGVDNITFRHGDILSLSRLERSFPLIECAGVLHHMQDPEAGLASLVSLLRPGGILKLGLYSELARSSIVAARRRIAELGLSSSAEDIRSFRRRILLNEEPDEILQKMFNFGDFYDLDSARDLMFHVQEHRYTVPQLDEMMRRQGLAFLGFTFTDPKAKRTYAERFPEDPTMTDLSLWQRFEEENPDTFRSMYQFWCQKVA